MSKRKFTLRTIYEAMLYGVPKVKGTFWKKEKHPKKGIEVIGAACGIGRAAMNLGLEDYNGLSTALAEIKISPVNIGGSITANTLGEFIIFKNDKTETSIEDIAEEMKSLVDLDRVIEV